MQNRLEIILFLIIVMSVASIIGIYIYNHYNTKIPIPNINGYVLNSANQALPGIPIMLYHVENEHECLYTSISKPSGQFLIPKPPPGTYLLKAIFNNEKITTAPLQIIPDSQYIQIQMNYEEANRLPPRGKLIISAYFLKNGKTMTPITGCSLTLSYENKKMTVNSFLDQEGHAIFEIPPGKYQFKATLSDMSYQSVSNVEVIIYDQQVSETSLTFQLIPQVIVPKGYLEGKVTINNNLLDQGVLELYGSHTSLQKKTIPISYQIPIQQGGLHIELQPGQYVFTPHISGSNFTPVSELKFTITDKQTSQVNIAFTAPQVATTKPPKPQPQRTPGLRPSTTMSADNLSSAQITVIDSGWNPRPDAQVVIISKSGEQYEGKTDDNGEVTFKDIIAGEYNITVEFVGLKGPCTVNEEFSVEPGKPASLFIREMD